MKHYAKTEGYRWTNGDGNYYIELYCPDNAPEYTLVAESEIPESETDEYEPTAEDKAEAWDILIGEVDV